ncbi:MAG TPA: PIG-L deacetylase family protein [Acidimicrobiales bacterium]|nr:PIG-L deacetylase family protein [Acidimicrobiales bacterium]
MTISRYRYDEGFSSALVVVAHPDDVDFGSGGTIAYLTDHGVRVAYCLVTSGDAGGDDSTIPREERSALRETEQTAAAKVLGVTDLTFLHWPDGQVEVTLELRRDIARVIRRVRPELVITQSPERNYARVRASHPDHMAVGEATLRAIYPDARNPHAFPELLAEGLAPHVVPLVWIAGSPEPTIAIDTTKRIARKVEALSCHASQVGDAAALGERIRANDTANAERAGLRAGHTGELFRVVATD